MKRTVHTGRDEWGIQIEKDTFDWKTGRYYSEYK